MEKFAKKFAKKKKMIHEPKHCSCLDSHFSKTNTSAELSPAAPGCVVCIPQSRQRAGSGNPRKGVFQAGPEPLGTALLLVAEVAWL